MPNAIEMLKEDHRKVQELFEQFEQTEDDQSKEELCEATLRELEIHATVEEEIFYPAAEAHLGDEELIDEAREEHHVAKLLMAELKKLGAGERRFDAKYKVLAESVKHHIREEESELFPKLQGDLDTEELGQRILQRKEKLQKQAANGSGARRSKKSASGRSRSGKSAKGPRKGSKKTRRKAAAGRR